MTDTALVKLKLYEIYSIPEIKTSVDLDTFIDSWMDEKYPFERLLLAFDQFVTNATVDEVINSRDFYAKRLTDTTGVLFGKFVISILAWAGPIFDWRDYLNQENNNSFLEILRNLKDKGFVFPCSDDVLLELAELDLIISEN